MFSLENRNYLFYQGGRHPIANISEHVRVQAVGGFRDELVRATNAATRAAAAFASENAPYQKGKLSQNIKADTDPGGYYHPGGVGGGGNWTSNVYVDTLAVPYAPYLLFGTGIYGEKKREIDYGKTVRFFWHNMGRPMAVRSILGTPVQDEWWEDAFDVFKQELSRRTRRIYTSAVQNRNF